MYDFRRIPLFFWKNAFQSTKWLYFPNIRGKAWPLWPPWLRLYFCSSSSVTLNGCIFTRNSIGYKRITISYKKYLHTRANPLITCYNHIKKHLQLTFQVVVLNVFNLHFGNDCENIFYFSELFLLIAIVRGSKIFISVI